MSYLKKLFPVPECLAWDDKKNQYVTVNDHPWHNARPDIYNRMLKVWQARAKMSSWISVDGYKNIPVGEWLVYMPDERDSIQAAHIHKNVSTIGGNFAFDRKKVTKYRPLPSLDGE